MGRRCERRKQLNKRVTFFYSRFQAQCSSDAAQRQLMPDSTCRDNGRTLRGSLFGQKEQTEAFLAAVQHKNCIRRRTKRAKHFKALQNGEWGRGMSRKERGKGMSSGFKYWQRRERRNTRNCRGHVGCGGREGGQCGCLLPPDVDSFACALGEPLQQTHRNKQTNTETHKHRHLQRQRSEQCTGTTCCCGRGAWRLCKQMVDCYIKCEKHAACSCQKKNNSKSSEQSTTSRYPVEKSFGQSISKSTVQYL